MEQKQKYSKCGIVSIILAIVTWVYFVVMTLIVVNTEYLTLFIDRYIAKRQSKILKEFGEFSTAIMVMLILFLGIPVLIHLIGIIFGLIGTFSKTKKRLFGIIGLLANLIPFLLLVGLSIFDNLNN